MLLNDAFRYKNSKMEKEIIDIAKEGKWESYQIPKALSKRAKKLYSLEGFPNVSQFIHQAVREKIERTEKRYDNN